MKKIITYLRYLTEYLRHGDFVSIVSSVKYLINRTSHGSDRLVRTSVGTFYCRKNTNDFQFANYYYEWSLKKFMLGRIHEFTVFIDGGACIGVYSILLSKYNLRCIAFEPLAVNYMAMLKNLELNKLTGKVKPFPIALGNENIQARFKFNPVNTGASSVDNENSQANPFSELRSFDSILSLLEIDRNEKILFKLDIEGMEVEALQGTHEFIRQYPNITFLIEYKHSGVDKVKSVLESMAEFEIGIVDEFNLYARKIRNLKTSEMV